MQTQRQSYTTGASSSKKLKISKPDEIKNYEPPLIDTPGLGTNSPLDNGMSIRGVHRLGELPEAPLTPKRGDIYFDTQKRKLYVYETRRRVGDRDKFAIDTWAENHQYYVGDYMINGPYLYVCITDHYSSPPFDPTVWRIENVIRRRVPLEASNVFSRLGSPQGIPTNVWTKLIYNLHSSNRGGSMLVGNDITIDNPGTYIIIGYTNWINDSNSIQRKTRVLINGVEAQQSTANSARVTVTTTGTDSLGGSISATSTVNYSTETAQNNPVLIRNLVPGDVITLEVRHNKGSQTQILQNSYLQVKQL